ncbi:protein white-like isoform X2 [Eriocheir sinensis]|uniref:protein white-like isoform X2 n=1 Tax=Eriocheir sinensis TaxID=95602 RepID=UPI0021C63A09|nr:protein white-like isoform X2 [Eriocheir sinensis]
MKMKFAAGALKKGSESGSDNSVVVETDDEQLVYSWHRVNVYTTLTSVRGSGVFKRKTKESREKHILKDVTGVCRPGELLAIMGASGAGKTTLLNVLTHRNNDKLRVTGDLFVNGRRVDPDTLTSRSAYVQQDDLFIGLITVREQLIFQAMVRMDRHLTYSQRMTRVDEVISELGLTKCADTKIGVPGRIKGISGGEMKRLAFACEVLTNPPLMLCDEPTSGLDSFMAQNVVAVMKNMAERGKTIISTIHQPSSEVYAMFDRVLLMAEGRVAFLGEVDAAYEFFSRINMPCPPNYNPADFFISTLAVQPGKEDGCRKAINMICDEFAKSEEGLSIEKAVKENSAEGEQQPGYDSQVDVDVKKSPYKASWWTQFRNVLWRSWLEVIREPMLIKVRFFQVMAIALLIGVIYFGQSLTQEGVTNINGALFLLLTNMTFQNVFGVINTFCAQLPLFLREHFNGMYRTDVYFISKMMSELPFHVIYPFAFVSIAYYMVGFTNNVVDFFVCALIVILVANCAVSFGYMISCMSRNLSIALAIASPLIIPLMLFGGFFLNSGSTPVYLTWLKYLSWFSYGNEALLINQWSDVKSIACRSNETCYPDGHAVLSFLHYEGGTVTANVVNLVILMVGYRLLAFFALLGKTYRKQ